MSICNFNNVTVKTSRCTDINTAAGANAVLKVYDNSAGIPADASVAAVGVLLATLACSATFGVVTTGVSGGAKPYLTANAITSANGVATGTPGYCRLQTSGGVGVVDLDVGATGSGASVIMTPDTITSGAPVAISSVVINEA